MTDASQLTAEDVLGIVQKRFPREYEIAVQQAYIANLEAALRDKGGDGGDELPGES